MAERSIHTDAVPVVLAQIAYELTPPASLFGKGEIVDFKRQAEFYAAVYAGLLEISRKSNSIGALTKEQIAQAFKWQD